MLITNFLHHFDPPTCTAFMRKVHAALQSGGRAAIAELVPNPDRVTPPTAAAFSMMMLATTPAAMPTLLQNSRAFRKMQASLELSSRRRRSASIAWSLRTGELRTERQPALELRLAWITLVLFRTRRRDECSRLKEGVRRRVRKSRQKEAAGAADAGLMQIEWSEGGV